MKILLIMPRFFNYPDVICDEMRKMGYEVDFFDDRPSTNAWIKAVIRINKNLIRGYIEKYFNGVLEEINKKTYDIVLLISGQSLSFSEDMISRIRKSQSQAYFVLYQWDSQTNFPYITNFHKYFDNIYSFDRFDALNTPRMIFLPLFYSYNYEKIGQNNSQNYKYDFCFVGTAHPQKYRFIKQISEQLRSVYPKQFIYFFFPSKIVYYFRKINDKELRHAKIKEFNFIPLNSREIEELYLNTKCVLDSSQFGQTGLTIRVIEALGAKKKIITTNEDVVNYDFYRPENVYVYNGKINYNDVFFTHSYLEIDSTIYEKYSLKNWIKEIVSGESYERKT